MKTLMFRLGSILMAVSHLAKFAAWKLISRSHNDVQAHECLRFSARELENARMSLMCAFTWHV